MHVQTKFTLENKYKYFYDAFIVLVCDVFVNMS